MLALSLHVTHKTFLSIPILHFLAFCLNLLRDYRFLKNVLEWVRCTDCTPFFQGKWQIIIHNGTGFTKTILSHSYCLSDFFFFWGDAFPLVLGTSIPVCQCLVFTKLFSCSCSSLAFFFIFAKLNIWRSLTFLVLSFLNSATSTIYFLIHTYISLHSFISPLVS